jgi:hypothetical protein
MSIPFEHPQVTRQNELYLTGLIVFLGTAMILIVLWVGAGMANFAPMIPGTSVWEVFMWRLPGIDIKAIPIVVTLVTWTGAQIFNSWHFQHWTQMNGVTSGETAFAIIGTWVGSTFAATLPEGEYTRQVMVWYGSSIMTGLFILISALFRPWR